MHEDIATMVADELDLIETIRFVGEAQAIQFFALAGRLFQELQLTPDDKRLSLTTTANRRFAFTIGQRYCLAYVPEENYPWHFISIESLPSTAERTESNYSGTPLAYYERCLQPSDVENHFDLVVSAAKVELNRAIKSGFSKHSNQLLSKAIADKGAQAQILEKAKLKPGEVSGRVWKLGSTWGEKAPSFYDFIQKETIVLADGKRPYAIGDLIMVTDGHPVKAIALVTGEGKLLRELQELHADAVQHGLPLDYELLIYPAEWYELPKDQVFYYKSRQGKVLVKDPETINKVKARWANRKTNYWLFQGNAEQYDFAASLRNNALISWVVKAHQDKISTGDKAIIWITGKGGGCVALAEIIAAPGEITETDRDYWKTPPMEGLRAGLRITHDFSLNPISREEMAQVEALNSLNAGNQGTNFRANYNEYQALLNLRTKSNPIKAVMHHLAFNTIFYGPPGTGKTYKMQGLMKDHFIDQYISRNPQEVLTEKLQPYPLWKVLAAALSQFQQSVSVAELHETTLVMAKLNPDIKVPRNSMWRTLQSYADELSSGIDAKYKASLQIFSKDKKSRWSLMESKKHELEDIIEPELLALAKDPIAVTSKPQQTLAKRYRFITFHQKYSYEDFIEGIKPVLQDTEEEEAGGLQFTLKKGIFYEAALQALKLAGYHSFAACYEDSFENRQAKFSAAQSDTTKHFALFIDEINRANISAVFGELITLLEDDKRAGANHEMWVKLLASGEMFSVPLNLYVIGTMNTADRSIALLDIALRRRFHFEGLYPKYDFDKWWGAPLKNLNEAIKEKKGNADLFIGHAFFMDKGDHEMTAILNRKIIPLLNEYCQNSQKQVQEILDAAKIEYHAPAIENNYQTIAK